MIRLLGDLLIGWIIFTPEGKNVANKIVGTAFNTVKNNITNSSQLKEIFSMKDIFIKGNTNDTATIQQDNRTKN